MPTTNNNQPAKSSTLSLPALIGGSSLHALRGCGEPQTVTVPTPYQGEAINLQYYADHSTPFLFVPRHGQQQHLAPHQINYRAIVWALRQGGARCVVSLNTVGGIHESLQPGMLCLPDQVIDYTWGRANTYYDPTDRRTGIPALDFSEPYSAALRARVMEAAQAAALPLVAQGTYGCTQGPRLETAAEIRRLQRDGCDMVGMTAMPEAILARELNLPYCSLALVVNRAAGLPGANLDIGAMHACVEQARDRIEALLRKLLPALAAD
ncbi:MAG TPA: S-methyl-5'-thioinosine phosphorylase [Hyphomicrobiales bacterium]|nr:S-methyl-5'-thioinosine phosphorylase [Hyphomicrobiales bacterium]